MKVLSLFDGISCARVALERAGIPVEAYYASEIDKYATEVSQNNYPHIKRLGDVTQVALKDSTNGYYEFDLLIGGSPCQDLSIAKRDRKGLDGERSGLFWEYVRILNEVKPKYFILENVNSMPKEAKQIITETLGVEPIMINAALVSAQNRKRLFWTNIPNVTLPEDRGILLKDILEKDVDEKYNVSLQHTQAMINTRKSKKLNIPNEDGKCGTITASYYKIPNDGNYIRQIGQIGKGGQGDRIYSPEGKKPEYNGTDKANSMTTVQTDSMVQENSIIRKLTPVECERLQGLPDNYTEGISSTQRYKCCGNAFNVDVVAHILSFIPHET